MLPVRFLFEFHCYFSSISNAGSRFAEIFGRVCWRRMRKIIAAGHSDWWSAWRNYRRLNTTRRSNWNRRRVRSAQRRDGGVTRARRRLRAQIQRTVTASGYRARFRHRRVRRSVWALRNCDRCRRMQRESLRSKRVGRPPKLSMTFTLK